MYMSLEFEKKFLGIFGGENCVGITPYCGLFLSDPTDNGTGAEISYDGYIRQPIQFSQPAQESGGIGIKNIEESVFPQLPNGSGGTVRYIGIYDSAVGGTMYLYGKLTEDLVLTEGQEPVIIKGEMLFYSTGNLSAVYKTKLFDVLRGQNIAGFEPHMALWSGNPDNTGTELQGANYARIPLKMSDPLKTQSGQMSIHNTVATAFERPTTTWGLWSCDVIADSVTGGNAVWLKERVGKTISKGIMPKIAANAITIGVN